MCVGADRGHEGMNYLVMSVGAETVEVWILCNMKRNVDHFCEGCKVDKGENVCVCVFKDAIMFVIIHILSINKPLRIT